MTDTRKNLCPCSSGKLYEECCKPLHEGKVAENAEQLMRSRFSAYALNLPKYIIKTTHPSSPQYSKNKFAWKRSISQFSTAATFDKLEILDFKENKMVATVTFTAYITQDDADSTFTEKSYFEFLGGRWLYRSGRLEEGHAPNLVTTGQLKLLPLAYYGDPILRKVADPVGEITDEIRALAEEMIETMDACDGLGLAAPQVHHSIRMFVTRPPPAEDEAEKHALGEVKVFINPKITASSSETWRAEEGCLSIPAIHGDVKRAHEITVEYTDLEGKTKTETFSGWPAKIFQHENDHIDGILFIDYLDVQERQKLEPLLKNLEKHIHDGTEM